MKWGEKGCPILAKQEWEIATVGIGICGFPSLPDDAQHDSLRTGAPRSGGQPGWGKRRWRRFSAGATEPVVADGLQRAEGLAAQGPLSVLDDHSRYLIRLAYRAGHVRRYGARATGGSLQQCGVPEGMLMDHGLAVVGMQSPCGMTWLSLWLMRQGMFALQRGWASANAG